MKLQGGNSSYGYDEQLTHSKSEQIRVPAGNPLWANVKLSIC